MTLRGAAPTVVVAAVVLLAASACGRADASNPPARHIDELDRLVNLATQHLRTANTVAARQVGHTRAEPCAFVQDVFPISGMSGCRALPWRVGRRSYVKLVEQVEGARFWRYGAYGDDHDQRSRPT